MYTLRTAVAFLGMLVELPGQSDLATPKPYRWDTCDWVEGKGGDCRAGNPSRPFQEYLQPALMVKDEMSGISAELAYDLERHPNMVAKWIEVGELSGHRVRLIEFLAANHALAQEEEQLAVAGLLVIERTPGLFAPLLRWSGAMPKPSVFNAGKNKVLVVNKDFGGNVPMVATWAWVWDGAGPMRIEVEKAMREALAKVAPGHQGYDTGLDWPKLHGETWTWGPDGYPGKVGVHEGMEAWFELRGNRLQVKRAIWRDSFDQTKPVRHWP